MYKVFELLRQFGVTLDDEQSTRLKAALAEENVPEENREQLSDQLAEITEKYRAATDLLAEREREYAAEKLLSGYKFASERVRNSVLEEFRRKDFAFENGAFIGGKEFLEELKRSEPETFAKENPGLFMSGTRGNVPENENDLEFQIFGGFGLKK